VRDAARPSQSALRRIRVYAVDPSFSSRLDTAPSTRSRSTFAGDAGEGPTGEYLSVEDVDDAGKRLYKPVDLDDSRLLAQDGWAPSEGNPQFHQQMVYAVAMKTSSTSRKRSAVRLCVRSESKRRAMTASSSSGSPFARTRCGRQRLLQPAADRAPLRLLRASRTIRRPHAGSPVYACLSHDIVAHETTHAILDGMHRHFNEPPISTSSRCTKASPTSSPPPALHDPDVLKNEIAAPAAHRTESILGSLAVQFGRATGGRGALRDAIGSGIGTAWKRFVPDPADLQKRLTPHSRGAILVGAVFDAFIAIYNDASPTCSASTRRNRRAAFRRHPSRFVNRLAAEASKSAGHVLNMCIRALDYLPRSTSPSSNTCARSSPPIRFRQR